MSVDAPYLEVTNGDLKGTQFRLLGDQILIGRSEECHVRLVDVKGVSRTHAQLILSGGTILLRDMGSANGTTVNGKKVSEIILQSGSKVKIGQVSLRLVIPGAGGALAPLDGDLAAAPASESGRALAGADSGRSYAAAPQGGDGAPASMMMAAGQGAGKVLSLFASIAGLVGLIYLMNTMFMSDPERISPVRIVGIQGKEVLLISTPFTSFRAKGKSATNVPVFKAEKYVGLLRDETLKSVNEHFGFAGFSKFRFVVVTGLARGEGYLVLEGSNRVIKEIPIIVRGAKQAPWIRMSEDEQRVLARQSMRSGRKLAGDQLFYRALLHFDTAATLYSKLEEHELRSEAQRWRSEVRNKLRETMNKGLVEAIRLAFPKQSGAGSIAKPMRGYHLIEDLKRMIADPENVEWQILDHLRIQIKRYVQARG